MTKPRFFDRKLLTGVFAVIVLSAAMGALGPAEILDAKFYYTGAEAHALLLSYSADEADRYFKHELLDLLLIAAYTSVLYMALKKRLPNLVWLAFPAAFFDLIETSLILYGLKVEPIWLDQLGFVTAAKWVCLTVAKAAVIYGLLRLKFGARKP